MATPNDLPPKDVRKATEATGRRVAKAVGELMREHAGIYGEGRAYYYSVYGRHPAHHRA